MKRNDLSLYDLQSNIIQAVTAKTNERADNLEKMVKENASCIKELKASVNFAFSETQKFVKKCAVLEKTIASMVVRLADSEIFPTEMCSVS